METVLIPAGAAVAGLIIGYLMRCDVCKNERKIGGTHGGKAYKRSEDVWLKRKRKKAFLK